MTQKPLKIISLLLCLASPLVSTASAQTVEQLQAKLAAAQNEIDALKVKLSKAQANSAPSRSAATLPPVRSASEALAVEHPILSAYEFSILAADPTIDLKTLLKNKVVSLTGSVERFADGIGRGFTVFLDSEGSNKEVACKFYAGTDVDSVHTQDEGSEMIIEHHTRGKITLAQIRQKVIISGFYDGNKRSRVTLNSCVLQTQ